MPLFLRFLGNDMYALWGYIITFTGMFGFADLGLGVAVGRHVSVALGKNDLDAVCAATGAPAASRPPKGVHYLQNGHDARSAQILSV